MYKIAKNYLTDPLQIVATINYIIITFYVNLNVNENYFKKVLFYFFNENFMKNSLFSSMRHFFIFHFFHFFKFIKRNTSY